MTLVVFRLQDAIGRSLSAIDVVFKPVVPIVGNGGIVPPFPTTLHENGDRTIDVVPGTYLIEFWVPHGKQRIVAWQIQATIPDSFDPIRLEDLQPVVDLPANWQSSLAEVVDRLLQEEGLAEAINDAVDDRIGQIQNLTWQSLSSNAVLDAGKGYLVDALSQLALTLPTGMNGDRLRVMNVLSGYTLNPGAARIRCGEYVTSVGGALNCATSGTLIELHSAGSEWICAIESGLIEIV